MSSPNGENGGAMDIEGDRKDKGQVETETAAEAPGPASQGASSPKPQPLEIEGQGASNDATTDQTTAVQYKTYRRRWFGLVQLTVLNIIVSWGVSVFVASLNGS